MACSGCAARQEWIKRKAKLAAQVIAAKLKLAQKQEEQKDAGKTG